MVYRPEQKNGNGKSESLNDYYERKQKPKHNRVDTEAEVLHDADTDAENAHYSYGSKGYERPRGGGKSGGTIWDDD